MNFKLKKKKLINYFLCYYIFFFLFFFRDKEISSDTSSYMLKIDF